MQEFFQIFLFSNPFIPHGHCYLWKPGLVGLHLISDVLIAFAYFSIPLTLIYFIRQRRDIPFNKIFLLFSAFIVACGTTHIMEVWTLWHPTYWLSGFIKAITAFVSLYTAVTLVSLLPKALVLPSLAATNQKLEAEIAQRQKSEAKSRAILATIPDLMFQTNAEGVYLGYVTPHRTSDLLPQTVDPTGRRMSDLLPPDIAHRHMEHIQRTLETNELQTYEQQVQIGDRLQYEEVRVMRCGDDEVLFMIRDISDRKRAEAATFQLAAIVESSEDAIISKTLDGVIVSWNAGAQRLFGYTAQEIIGQPVSLMIPADRKNEESQILKKLRRGEQIEHFDTVRQRKDGTLVDISLTVSPVKDATGKIVGASKIARDVSARKQAEEERRQAERLRLELHLLENILEVSLAGYFDWDIPGDREYLSPTFKRMFGYEDDELPNTPQTWKHLIFPEDLPRLLESFDQHVTSRGQIPYYNEVRYRHKNGSTVWVICSGRVIEWDQDGNPLRMIGCHINISKRKQIEQALNISEARHRAIVEDQTELIARFLPDTTIVFVNEAYCRYFGLQREEIIGKSYEPVIFEEDLETVAQLLQSMSAENPTVTTENRVIVNGEIRWTQWINRMLLDKQEQFVELQSVGRDITELKQIEATLKRYERIVSTANDGIALLDRNYIYQIVNQAYLDWCNKSHSEVVGHSVRDVLGSELFDNFIKPRLDRCLAGEIVQYEKWFDYPNLVPQFLSVSYVPYLDADQNISGIVVSLRDITNLQQTEEALRISEERLKLALEGSGDGLWDWNIVTGEIYLSSNWLEMLGYAADELPRHVSLWEQLIHPDDKPWVMDRLNAHLQNGSAPYAFDYRVLTKSGEWKWVANYGKVVARDENGTPLRMVGTHQDISERKRAEEALRESERRYATLAEASPVAIFRLDSAGHCIYVNDRWGEMTGRPPQTALGMGWLEAWHPEDRDRMMMEWSQKFEQGDVNKRQLYQSEGRHLRPDGSINWFYSQVQPETDLSGIVSGYVGILMDISEAKRDEVVRKQAEEQLRNLSDRLAVALKSGAIGIWEWDIVGDVLNWDDRMYELYGLQPSVWIGTLDEAWTRGVHPDDIAQAKAAVRQSLQNQKEFATEFRIVRSDGSIRFIKASALVQRNEQGEPQRMVGINYDITDRKLAERELEESRTMLRLVIDTIPQRVFWKDRQLRYLGCNHAFASDYRLTPDAIIGRTDLELPRAKWAHLCCADDAVVMNTRTPKLGCEERTESLNGEPLWLRTSIVPLTNSAGDVIGIIGSYENITDRKLAEEALAKYAHEVEDLYNNAPCGYHSLDAEGRFVNINETELQWLGYTREEVIGKSFTNFITQTGQSVFEQNYSRFQEQGWVKDLEYNMICKDGTILPVLLNATAVKSADGTYLYNRATLFDIRERKLAEQTLQELNSAMQNAVEGISFIDIDGRYVSINRAYANLCGYEPEELVGQLWQQTVYSEDLPDLIAAYQQMLETGKVEAEARGIRKDGSVFYKQVTMVTARDEQGNITGHHCFMKDISDRKYAEAQLRQTNEQLARATRLKDEFLANMSHELRTPLNAILGMSEGLQEGVFGSINKRQVKAIATIERSGKHLLELINDILDLSKIESGKLELQISDVPVKSLCDGSLGFIRQMALKKNIHLSTRIPDNLGSIQADDRRLRQVLINLLSNAVKFTPEAGSVTLEVRLEEAEESGESGDVNSSLSSLSPLSGSSSPRLCFCVIDTGIGIAAEDMGKLFQAFVQIDSSLNRQYSGTGLGLALVQRITTLHGGTVSVESEVGRGSCFTVCIPYHSNNQVTRMQVATPLLNRSFRVDNAQVLIIEDSISAADQIARYLSEYSMQSIIYRHGEGALEEVLRVQPSLVILDLLLPNQSGWDVLTQLKIHPQTQDIPVLIVSVVDERSRALAMGASEYLVKPISRVELLATLKNLQCPILLPESTAPIVVPEPVLESPLILLAEDNQATTDTISGYLESRGYRLILANDGEQAIALTKAQRPNLILMDIQMPGMDGLEAMRHIRAEGQTHVPIIALTALAMPSDREKCLEAGANEYLTKPIKLKQLVATIQQLLLQTQGNSP